MQIRHNGINSKTASDGACDRKSQHRKINSLGDSARLLKRLAALGTIRTSELAKQFRALPVDLENHQILLAANGSSEYLTREASREEE